MSFYNKNEMRLIRAQARRMNLTASDAFWRWSTHHLQQVCNGCGPDGWCEAIRRLASDLLVLYAPAFAIHDVDYTTQNVSREFADQRMLKNMRKIWKNTYGWKGYFCREGRLARAVITPVYLAVRSGGDSAWQAAGEAAK